MRPPLSSSSSDDDEWQAPEARHQRQPLRHWKGSDEQSWEDYLDYFRFFCRHNGYRGENRAGWLYSALPQEATVHLSGREGCGTFRQMVTALGDRYGSVHYMEQREAEFRRLVWDGAEDGRKYLDRLTLGARLAYPDRTAASREREVARQFTEGLAANKDLLMHVLGPATSTDKRAAMDRFLRQFPGGKVVTARSQVKVARAPAEAPVQSEEMQRILRRMQELEKKLQAVGPPPVAAAPAYTPPVADGAPRTWRSRIECWACGQKGHSYHKCATHPGYVPTAEQQEIETRARNRFVTRPPPPPAPTAVVTQSFN